MCRKRRASRVLEQAVLEIALGSGLRVAEIARLACGDLALGKGSGSIAVRRGKGGKPRIVIISGELCRTLRRFLEWKSRSGFSIDHDSPLISARRTTRFMCTRALQKMFSRLQAAAGVSSHRFHDLRHTYGSYLLQASGNDLVFVRDQMGHSNITTTTVYLHALNAEKAVNALYA